MTLFPRRFALALRSILYAHKTLGWIETRHECVPARRPARLVVDAYQGPGDSEGEHMRDRAVTHMLDRDQLEAMWSAYEQGGDKGMQAWLSGTGESYLDGWRTGEIYDISVIGEDDYRRGRR